VSELEPDFREEEDSNWQAMLEADPAWWDYLDNVDQQNEQERNNEVSSESND
jgi:hypothetical protein